MSSILNFPWSDPLQKIEALSGHSRETGLTENDPGTLFADNQHALLGKQAPLNTNCGKARGEQPSKAGTRVDPGNMAASGAKPLSVLHVEDSESDAALIQRLLEKAGYAVHCQRVETAAEMHTALEQERWDVIIADYNLPQFNAESALDILQASGRDIPFIVVSGAVGEDAAVHMMKRGAHDFVTKGNLARLTPAVQREISDAHVRALRDRAEQNLYRSEREFRRLAESIPQLVWMTDATGKIIYCNLRLQRRLAANLARSSKHWVELLHPEDRSSCAAAWQHCLNSEKEFHCEGRLHLEGGDYHWFLLHAIPVPDEEGYATRWFGTCTDIDSQKQTQSQLAQANAELKRSNAMLEQFAYIASHDLQEPLRNVALNVQMLSMEYQGKLGSAADEYIRSASGSAVRMVRLIQDLLLFSRAGRPDKPLRRTDINHVLDEALANLSQHLKETEATVTRSNLPVVFADDGQLVQLFQNLVGNALKYRNANVPPLIDVSARRQPGHWVFAIRDNGIGINPRYFAQIFQIFKRLHTKEKYDGTGIGLAICERIIERHKGRLWVESAEGAGATFYFTISDRPAENNALLARAENPSSKLVSR